MGGLTPCFSDVGRGDGPVKEVFLSSNALARALLVSPETLINRHRHHRHYWGFRAINQPNGRLVWPVDRFDARSFFKTAEPDGTRIITQFISTKAMAEMLGVKPKTILAGRNEIGSYLGIRPVERLGRGRKFSPLWPIDDVRQEVASEPNLDHPMDEIVRRCEREGRQAVFWFCDGGFFVKKKGYRDDYFIRNPVCWLSFCELCGKFGSPMSIKTRFNLYGWNRVSKEDRAKTPSKDTLCMACWNSVRRIVRKEKEADECRRLLNKIERVISNERKNQNNRRAEGLLGQHDAGREERGPGTG